MAHSHVYSLGLNQWKMFTIGETRPNCDANEPQEDVQGTRHIRRGRLNDETLKQRERRLQIQREQRNRRAIRKPQSKDNITWFSKDNCAPSPSFARFCESRISSKYCRRLVSTAFI